MTRLERIQEVGGMAVRSYYIGDAEAGEQQPDITNLNQL
jgi:hypothetical protein